MKDERRMKAHSLSLEGKDLAELASLVRQQQPLCSTTTVVSINMHLSHSKGMQGR